MSEADATPQTLPKTSVRVRRAIRLGVACLAPVLLAAALWGGYRAVRYLRLRGYEAACRAAQKEADWAGMEQQATAWMRWQQNQALPWLFAAQAAQQQGDMARAAEYLEALPDGDPKTPEALLGLVKLYLDPLGKPLAGVAVCERILRRNPTVGAAHRRLIFFYAVTLQPTKIVRQAREAIGHHCEIQETYVQLMAADGIDVPDAYKWITKWLRNDPENELFLVARAFHYMGAKGLREAADRTTAEAPSAKTAAGEKLLAETMTRFPKNQELLSYFLQRACQSGNVQRVAELLSLAPPETVEDHRFWRFKAWLHAARQEYSQAVDDYRQTLRLNPYDWRSGGELAAVLRRLDQPEAADVLESRAATGQELRQELLRFDDVKFIPTPILRRMADYARACHDDAVADSLTWRIGLLGQED